MANQVHLEILHQGVERWNAWREEEPSVIPDLSVADISGAELFRANLGRADLWGTKLIGANLRSAGLLGADLTEASLCEANLTGADLSRSNLYSADLSGANLEDAYLEGARLRLADFTGANLHGARLIGSDLSDAYLSRASLIAANLTKANLRNADLSGAILIHTNLEDAILDGCRVYGIAAWDVHVSGGTQQHDLIITQPEEPDIRVDNIEVAQFVYLLLRNAKIRDVIDTVGRKGVLLLGRFTEGRIAILQRLRKELLNRGFVPIVFNFDKPETKDFTETVRVLAGLSHFVIADVTNPKSAPLELQAIVPECMVPFKPIIEEGQEPFAMLRDLWIQHQVWVFEPLYYSSVEALVGALDDEIIRPAEKRFAEILALKAENMKGQHV